MKDIKSCRAAVVGGSSIVSKKWLPVYLLECELDVKCES